MHRNKNDIVFAFMLKVKFKNQFLLIALLTLCFSCCSKTSVVEFDFNKSEIVKLNNIELNTKQIEQLKIVLNKLKKRNREVYNKPLYEITFENKGKIRYISIFEEDEFVFDGYFLDAWTDRMEGKKSNGYKLNDELKKLLTELRIETSQKNQDMKKITKDLEFICDVYDWYIQESSNVDPFTIAQEMALKIDQGIEHPKVRKLLNDFASFKPSERFSFFEKTTKEMLGKPYHCLAMKEYYAKEKCK